MPVIRVSLCAGCRAHVRPDTTCARCGTTHGKARDRERQRLSGRNTNAWKRLKAEAFARDGGCVLCGSTHDLTGDHLRYPAVTVDDVRTLCRSCNGRLGQAKGELTRRW